MTYDEAISYIHSISWSFCKPGLERIRELCSALGNPQDSLKFIHVAGTNGKGSFSAMTESILRAAGYKTGLFTSPYILKFNERMRIGSESISDGELAEITEYVKPYAEKMTDKPTEFELITAIALEYFKRHAVDVVVFEAGMGGRLDSTNIITTPVLSVITGIALDHTAYLGDTTEKIAAEKAGIIKHGVPVLFGGEDKAALEVIKARACELNSPFYLTDRSTLNVRKAEISGTEFDFGAYRGLTLSLLGSYQPKNAATVLTAIDVLRGAGYEISEGAVREGLSTVRWPARFEIISECPLVIFDGAHNAEGIAAAVESVKQYFKDKRVFVLSGVLRDKDYTAVAKSLCEIARHVFTVTPHSDRALDSKKYRDVLIECGASAEAFGNISSAISAAYARAAAEQTPLICLGSLYTYCEIKPIIDRLNSQNCK
ncbi:MAG: bifunctional folylpolyglutamate synthase/dihydrofolate synthase [Clostridia bacterium]|nr:bifunctional folylpolyglutamate synthase/dihydrofolate synthase [Clostridia bacterium]